MQQMRGVNRRQDGAQIGEIEFSVDEQRVQDEQRGGAHILGEIRQRDFGDRADPDRLASIAPRRRVFASDFSRTTRMLWRKRWRASHGFPRLTAASRFRKSLRPFPFDLFAAAEHFSAGSRITSPVSFRRKTTRPVAPGCRQIAQPDAQRLVVEGRERQRRRQFHRRVGGLFKISPCPAIHAHDAAALPLRSRRSINSRTSARPL